MRDRENEDGNQRLLLRDKPRLLSPAKCKISAIIRNITVEIWPDVNNLKIET